MNNILLFYHVPEIDFMFSWVRRVIDHRRSQNLGRISLTQLPVPCLPLFYFSTFSCHLQSIIEQTHGIYLLNKDKCKIHKFSSFYIFDVFSDLLLGTDTAT